MRILYRFYGTGRAGSKKPPVRSPHGPNSFTTVPLCASRRISSAVVAVKQGHGLFHLDSFFGYCFENLCREALPRLYEREGISAAFSIGEYWDKEVQIDVVGLRDDNWTDLGECKWGQIRSQKQLIAELDRKVSVYPNPRNATIGRRLFLNKISPKIGTISSGLHWHSLIFL
jgi:hypothetical protein